MPRILFVGGGSIGHIAPALAVWETLRKHHPDAEAHFVCAHRPEEERYLSQANVEFTGLAAPKIGWGFPWKFWMAWRHAGRILSQYVPDIVFSKGGFVSMPVCLAARRRNIPIIVHESDAVMGRANRLLARWAMQVCRGFPGTERECPRSVYTGNPVRESALHGDRQKGLELTGFSGKRPILLVMGGSQGAAAINESIKSLLPVLGTFCDTIHITGEGKGETRSDQHYWSRPFVPEGLRHLYAIADIAVSRAGAGSISELAANGIPMVLVPLRGVGHDHQQKNAEAFAKSGACLIVQQECLQSDLVPLLKNLAEGGDVKRQLAVSMSKATDLDANGRIARIIWSSVVRTA